MAYLIEVFGWFGVEKAGFEWRKAIGAAVAICGDVISSYGWKINFCLCLKGVLVRIELRTKRASEKEGAEDETRQNQTVKSETMDANRAVGVVFLAAVLWFWCAEPAREADGGVGDAESVFKRRG